MREEGGQNEGHTWGRRPGSHQSAGTRSSESQINRKKVKDVKKPQGKR